MLQRLCQKTSRPNASFSVVLASRASKLCDPAIVCQSGGTLRRHSSQTPPRYFVRPPDGVSLFVMQGFERMDALLLVARLILAAVFLISGISKLFDLKGAQAAM